MPVANKLLLPFDILKKIHNFLSFALKWGAFGLFTIIFYHFNLTNVVIYDKIFLKILKFFWGYAKIMKYQVMIKILMILLARRKVTATEIASRYDVSVRSVYRYVEELVIAGVPIDVVRGRYGGLVIPDTFKLPAGYFTRDEYSAILNSLNAMSSQINDEHLKSAIDKFERQIKSEKRELSVCSNIIVDCGTWGDVKSFPDKMRVCESAINTCTALDIDYISRQGEHSRRIIEPHVLILKQGVWYVYAFCHTKQDFRLFRIGRIKSATVTDKKFKKEEIKREQIPLNFSYSTEDLYRVVLEVEKSALPDVEEWLGIDNIEPRANGFVAEAELPGGDELVGKILSFGGRVKVIAPQTLKERVSQTAKNILNSYK